MDLRFLWRTWRAGYWPEEKLRQVQMQRLNQIIAFARQYSPFYAEKYRALPETITDIEAIPHLTKAEILENYDQLSTDPAVTQAGVEEFVSDLGRLGQFYLGRYAPWITSGTTGERLVSLGDAPWLAAMGAQNVARMALPHLTFKGIAWRLAKGPGRSAYILATEGHFSGVWLATNLLKSPAGKAARVLVLPVTLPPAEMVERLNTFQPTMLTGYASALGLLAEAQGGCIFAPSASSIPPRRCAAQTAGCCKTPSAARCRIFTHRRRWGSLPMNAHTALVMSMPIQSSWKRWMPTTSPYRPVSHQITFWSPA
jgi:phenylacetate-coenzyme A ligase PaaK-like adenylate-forming protein